MQKNCAKKIFLETIRDITSFGNPLILIILMMFIVGINKTLLIIILGLAVVELFCTLIKIFYHKDRPINEKYSNLIEKITAGSFPSLHTARSSFVFLTLFFIMPFYSIKTISLVMIIFVGTSRIILKKHHLPDVLAGLLIGIIFSLLWMKFII